MVGALIIALGAQEYHKTMEDDLRRAAVIVVDLLALLNSCPCFHPAAGFHNIYVTTAFEVTQRGLLSMDWRLEDKDVFAKEAAVLR